MVKQIETLTDEQTQMMSQHAQEWIAKGLQTGATDWETFDKYMPICYEKAGLVYPKNIVRVTSPLVGAFAASLAEGILSKKRGAVRGAVGGAVRDAVDDAVGGAVRDAVDDAVDGAVGGAVGDAVGGAVRDAVDGAVRDAVDGAVRDAVGGAVGGAVDGAVGGAVGDAVGGAVDGAVRDAVGDAVRDAVGGAVDGAVRGAVGGAVRDAVGGAVGGAVRDAVRDAVGDAVDGAVGGAVRDADKMTKSAVSFSINLKTKLKLNITWHYWLGGQFWVGWSWGWRGVAYTDFFINKCGLELEKDIMERAEANKKISESVSYIWANSDFVIVCERPKEINRNNDGALHNPRGMSISWSDGWGLYHLNGVRFDEELFLKVTSGTMPFSDILSIPDIDQRVQAMKYGDVWEFVKHAKGELLDTHSKFGKDGREVKYWLYTFPAGEIFTEQAYYMIYEDSMTPKEKTHMQGVVKTNTVAEAMAWKQHITPELWTSLVLDVDFT